MVDGMVGCIICGRESVFYVGSLRVRIFLSSRGKPFCVRIF